MAVRTCVSSILISFILRWILILFLLVEASFSFSVTRFCRRYKLKIPCILCSWLDHVLACSSEKLGFYQDLCDAHKLQISSLALCHLHQKLADAPPMCEACLLSSATEKNNPETSLDRRWVNSALIVAYLLLTVKNFPRHDAAKVPLVKDDIPSSSATRICSCCLTPYRHKPHTLKLVQHKAMQADISEVDNPAC